MHGRRFHPGPRRPFPARRPFPMRPRPLFWRRRPFLGWGALFLLPALLCGGLIFFNAFLRLLLR
ncbi:MAG: hypothetical protein H6665_01320 [Ardenticatenaceae bacterium]|nr:hypothetical protein [Ardenticatenaceae bacterium]